MKRLLFILLISLIVLYGITISNGIAETGTPPDLKISLSLDKTSYILNDPNDPIVIVMTLENVGLDGIITSEGFSERPFYLYLTFIDPDGKGITANELGSSEGEGGPPQIIPVDTDGDTVAELVQVEAVEVLPVDPDNWVLSVTLPDARAYYSLTKAGNYYVKAIVSMRTYQSIFQTVAGRNYSRIDDYDFAGVITSSTEEKFILVSDADGDGYSYPEAHSGISSYPIPDCNDNDSTVNPGVSEVLNNGKDDDCNPLTTDVVAIPPGTIIVKADKHTVGSGSYPASTKSPMPGLPVRVFDKSSGCVSRIGVSWQNYKSIWLSCFPQENGGIGMTDVSGNVNLTVAPGNYIVLGEYDQDGNPDTDDKIYIGVSGGNLVSGETVQKYLQVIVKADGKKVPAKYTVKTGSELLIIEPEYIEWDGIQELYPFVLESVGDWAVATSVNPPEGFIADNESLSTDVNTTLKVLQFSITDIGSEWVDTVVTHRIKHKGKSEIVKSRIGVKLSERLAKAKGLSRFGEDKNKKKGGSE